ncbi:hypothetical protein SAMN02910456_00417 [Ruminococcaceae bacterium YRB3002]|nr:hypothetical protein SAMN02910456_00417 [Ruminococcaceae bacterium YRB3002]
MISARRIASLVLCITVAGAAVSCKTLTPDDKTELVPTVQTSSEQEGPWSGDRVPGGSDGDSMMDYVGQWETNEYCELDPMISGVAESALAGTSSRALLYLGSQSVAGANYCFLCIDGDSYKLVFVNEDLNSNITVTKTLDLSWPGAGGGWSLPSDPTAASSLEQMDSHLTDDRGNLYVPLAYLGSNENLSCYYVAVIPEEPDSPAYKVAQAVITLDSENPGRVSAVQEVDIGALA